MKLGKIRHPAFDSELIGRLDPCRVVERADRHGRPISDHAPHHADEKHVEFDRAPFGITGLETAVALCFDRLVHAGVVSLSRLVELLSVNPARVLNVPGGSLAEGAPADISILAPDLTVTIAAASMRSLSKNTPFDGWTLRGGVAATIVGGRAVYVNDQAALRL